MLRHKITAGLENLENKRGHFHFIKTAGYSWIYAVSIFRSYFSFFHLHKKVRAFSSSFL